MTLDKKTTAYYDSPEANAFYREIWGDGIHVGIYRPKTLSVEEACQKTTDKMLRFIPKLGKSSKVLVLGSGLGGPARYLAEKFGSRIECLHFSETQNRHHQQKVEELGLEKKVTLTKGTFAPLPYERESFDLVWSQDMLLHSDKKSRTFREVQRVLKPKGRFVFTDILKSDECPDEVLAKLQARLPVKEMVSSDDYQRLAKRAPLLKVYAVEMPDQVELHFNKLSERLETTKPKGVEQIKKGIREWAQAAADGYLDWGIFIFQKINS